MVLIAHPAQFAASFLINKGASNIMVQNDNSIAVFFFLNISTELLDKYSRIPLSRAPLTRENQLVALAPWTPNFSDVPLATAHMTGPVTHMCWSEQISPLVHSPQATWQHFNLSHCIEMHNTHLLGRTGQLSQTYFTHSAPILTLRNLPPTVNKQWHHRENPVCHVTLASTPAKKWKLTRCTVYISWYKYSLQVDTTIDRNTILYFHCVESRSLSYLKCDSRICHREAHAALVKHSHACAKAFLFPVKRRRDLVDLTQNPSCVALHNVWFDSFVA